MSSAEVSVVQGQDNSRQWKDLLVLLVTNVVISFLAYVSNIGLANKMGPAGFGEYSYILVLGTFLNQFVIFGTEQLIIKKYMDRGEEAVAKIFRARFWNFSLVLVGVFVWVLISGELEAFYSLVIAGQGLCLVSVYEVHRENRRYAYIYLAERALYIFWLWGGIYLFGAIHLGWIFGSLGLWTALSIGWQFMEKRKYLTTPIKSKLVEVWTGGFGLVVFDYAKYMYGGGARLFIKQGLGFAALGVYSIVWQFVPLTSMYLTQITKSWRFRITEAIHKGDSEEFKKLMVQIVGISLGPILVGSVVFLIWGEGIVRLLFSEEYLGAVSLFPWLVAYFIVICLDYINSILWVALGKIRTFTVLFSIFSFICLLLMVWGKSRFQLEHYLAVVVLCHGLAILTSFTYLAPLLRARFSGK